MKKDKLIVCVAVIGYLGFWAIHKSNLHHRDVMEVLVLTSVLFWVLMRLIRNITGVRA